MTVPRPADSPPTLTAAWLRTRGAPEDVVRWIQDTCPGGLPLTGDLLRQAIAGGLPVRSLLADRLSAPAWQRCQAAVAALTTARAAQYRRDEADSMRLMHSRRLLYERDRAALYAEYLMAALDPTDAAGETP